MRSRQKFKLINGLFPFFRQLRHYVDETPLHAVELPGRIRTGHTHTEISRTRNIGIIAHIDAGKTTTTERMLYYSGHTRRVGNVDDGSTVTDFLPAERARGVTIQSAAISLNWPPLPEAPKSPRTADFMPCYINLIDTPGHADFTFEVQRSLRVLDGAICILDGVAGVEAQTEKVWNQSAEYNIPKIIYVNKLDRDGAAFGTTVKQVASRLRTTPAVCQIPWWDKENGKFMGIGDALFLRAIRWADGGDGTDFEILEINNPAIEPQFAEEIKKARCELVNTISNHDEQMVEDFFNTDEDACAIDGLDIAENLRYAMVRDGQNITPIFAGASLRNIGVQTLLDAVVQFLPDADDDAHDPEVRLDGLNGTLSELLERKLILPDEAGPSKKALTRRKMPNMALVENVEACALAFKVVSDARRGMLVYVRVYSGSLHRQTMLFNTNLQVFERAPQLLKMYASESVQMESLSKGQIGVIPGLKHTRTGDTLISYVGASPKTGPPAPLDSLQLRPIEVPPAVFFSSIEPHRVSEEKSVKSALEILVREDPSLHVTQDEESGQTLLSGMGDFHLEIAGDRLVNDLKARASIGPIEIAYRETILQPSPSDIYAFDREQGGKQGRASCIAQVSPLTSDTPPDIPSEHDITNLEDGNRITILLKPTISSDSSWDTECLPPHLTLQTLHSSLRNGALAALSRGINYAYPMHATHVTLTFDSVTHLFGTETTPAALSSAARLATKAALKATALEHGSALMELVMNVTVTLDETSLGAVVNDLSSSRGGHVVSLNEGNGTDGVVDIRGDVFQPTIKLDVNKVYVPPDPFGGGGVAERQEQDDGNRQRSITARVPLKEMVGYLKHLRSLTGGRGTFIMSPDRFERVVGQREKVLLRELRGY